MDSKIKHSVLIIDDESSNLKVLNHILGQDYTILTASNGMDGIERAKEYRPDLILLDIVMPDMDGYQTYSTIKKNALTRDIPVIFISGLDSDEFEKKGMALDAADFISKPFKAPIVRLRVRNHIMLRNAVNYAAAANRTKSIFLAKMSHEIRTPLNAILRTAGDYIKNGSVPQEISEAFSGIYNSGDMMRGIINSILDMSSIESGKLDLITAEYNIAGLINDIVFLNLVKYEKKPVKFILDIDENVPSKFIGDEIRIKQILNNLLSNAFNYTASGEVELSVSADSSLLKEDYLTLVFRVRDTGQGMTEDQLARLFDEYSAGDGLGINILMELIKMMNGGVIAKSEPGKGTLFTVRLPQKIVNAPVLGKEAAEKLINIPLNYERKSNNAKASEDPVPFGRVLVVDDVDINQFVLKETLSYYGLEIDLASNGEEAVEKVKANNYDLVIMDYIMPVMNGLEAVKEIRKFADNVSISGKNKFKELPIIAMTADTAGGIKELLVSGGYSDYISKPVDLQELIGTLRKWLKQDSANCENSGEITRGGKNE